MKTKIYSKENYSSYDDFQKSFIDELKQAFTGTKVIYRGKDAYITDFSIDETNLGLSIMADLDVSGEKKSVVLSLALKSGIVQLADMPAETYNEFADVCEQSNKAYDEEQEALRKEEMEKIKAEREAQEEIQRQLAEEKRYAKKVARALGKLEDLKPENTSDLFETPTTHYEVLGWIAKHLTSVRAAMPDYMEKWFVGKFGDVERYVVDSRKKTSGGFDYQWGLGLKLTFDADIKGPLEARATSQNKRVIDNVAFVWDLIENYGFQFGKVQNISQIKNEIPERNLLDFERGYAM